MFEVTLLFLKEHWEKYYNNIYFYMIVVFASGILFFVYTINKVSASAAMYITTVWFSYLITGFIIFVAYTAVLYFLAFPDNFKHLGKAIDKTFIIIDFFKKRSKKGEDQLVYEEKPSLLVYLEEKEKRENKQRTRSLKK